MHLVQEAVSERFRPPAAVAPNTKVLNEQYSTELSTADRLGLYYVKSYRFALDACVAGYLIKADIGPASYGYVILTYAPHARELGLGHLKDHIGANPDHYAARSLILGNPWPQTQEMIDQLEAGWKRRLAPLQAQQRPETFTACPPT